MSSDSKSSQPVTTANLPPVSPDEVEQERADEIDNIIPTRGYQMTPMVGLGGSAGSIQPLTEFFRAMPADSGMIFVVILHLSPTHESTLAELLNRATVMPVVRAADAQKVEPNHVYVIPPGKLLTTTDGHLRLNKMETERGKRMTVDIFFRSLADTHGPHATAIVLSGVDGDGAIGIKRIKERGGLTIAQDPDQAEYAGMPQSAINTGMVDWVLTVEDIPKRLVEFRKMADRLKLPAEDGPIPTSPPRQAPDQSEALLRELLVFLRTRTGHDFSCYKRATVVRRIARRMQVNGAEDLSQYLTTLRTYPGEAGAMVQDLLITVTNFFRDRDAFAALETCLPDLFVNRGPNDPVRVWVPACATGEEAYSIGMLLLEHVRTLESPPPLQIFACDLDHEAIQTARAGHYPDTIVADVSEERLRRFFVKDHRGYRVRRELREMILFATHDLLKDAPFSRMHLISCRNLLIYLNQNAQNRVLETLHFALKPGGLLFLGSSESVPDGNPLFRVLDKKHRLYAQQPSVRGAMMIPSSPTTLLRAIEHHTRMLGEPVVHGRQFAADGNMPFDRTAESKLDRATLTDLHFQMIERLGPPSVIVNSEYDVVHLSKNSGRFLQFAGGEPTINLVRVVNPALRVDLRSALYRASETNSPVEARDIAVEIEGKRCLVDLRVSPAQDIAPGFLLAVFEVHAPGTESGSAEGKVPSPPPEPLVRHLEREMEQVRGKLRDTVEQYEASTEELKASNEELQAMNEELRSATEELETSREELQSINEELTTVNHEMKGKVDELARATRTCKT